MSRMDGRGAFAALEASSVVTIALGGSKMPGCKHRTDVAWARSEPAWPPSEVLTAVRRE